MYVALFKVAVQPQWLFDAKRGYCIELHWQVSRLRLSEMRKANNCEADCRDVSATGCHPSTCQTRQQCTERVDLRCEGSHVGFWRSWVDNLQAECDISAGTVYRVIRNWVLCAERKKYSVLSFYRFLPTQQINYYFPLLLVQHVSTHMCHHQGSLEKYRCRLRCSVLFNDGINS
jgi:hypothetical protein